MESIYDYIKRNIEDFDRKEREALDTINNDRCPLKMAHSQLYEEIEELIGEYCEYYELNPDDYDTEDVFWDL